MKTVTSCIKNINLTNTLFIFKLQVRFLNYFHYRLIHRGKKGMCLHDWKKLIFFPRKCMKNCTVFFQFTNFNIALQNCSAKRMNQEILCCKVICFEMSEKEL